MTREDQLMVMLKTTVVSVHSRARRYIMYELALGCTDREHYSLISFRRMYMRASERGWKIEHTSFDNYFRLHRL